MIRILIIAGYSTTAIFDNITTSPNKITVAPIKNSTLTGFPINPKDNIDPGMSNITTSTTTRRPMMTSTTTRKPTTTTTVKAQTKKPMRKITPVKPTQQMETKETPFIFKITTSTTKYTELQDQSGISVSLYIEKVKKDYLILNRDGTFRSTLVML